MMEDGNPDNSDREMEEKHQSQLEPMESNNGGENKLVETQPRAPWRKPRNLEEDNLEEDKVDNMKEK